MKAIITVPAHKDIAPVVWKATFWPEELELKSPDEFKAMLSQAGVDNLAIKKALEMLKTIPSITLPEYAVKEGDETKFGLAVLNVKKENGAYVIEGGPGNYVMFVGYLLKIYPTNYQNLRKTL